MTVTLGLEQLDSKLDLSQIDYTLLKMLKICLLCIDTETALDEEVVS